MEIQADPAAEAATFLKGDRRAPPERWRSRQKCRGYGYLRAAEAVEPRRRGAAARVCLCDYIQTEVVS